MRFRKGNDKDTGLSNNLKIKNALKDIVQKMLVNDILDIGEETEEKVNDLLGIFGQIINEEIAKKKNYSVGYQLRNDIIMIKDRYNQLSYILENYPLSDLEIIQIKFEQIQLLKNIDKDKALEEYESLLMSENWENLIINYDIDSLVNLDNENNIVFQNNSFDPLNLRKNRKNRVKNKEKVNREKVNKEKQKRIAKTKKKDKMKGENHKFKTKSDNLHDKTVSNISTEDDYKKFEENRVLKEFDIVVADGVDLISRIYKDYGFLLYKKYKDEYLKYLKGREFIKKSLSLDPKNTDTLSMLGATWKNVDDNKAFYYYQKAYELDPINPYPLINYCLYYIKNKGEFEFSDELKKNIYKALEIRIEQAQEFMEIPWCFYDIASFLLILGKIEESLIYLLLGIRFTQDIWQLDSLITSLQFIESELMDKFHDLVEPQAIFNILQIAKLSLTLFKMTKGFDKNFDKNFVDGLIDYLKKEGIIINIPDFDILRDDTIVICGDFNKVDFDKQKSNSYISKFYKGLKDELKEFNGTIVLVDPSQYLFDLVISTKIDNILSTNINNQENRKSSSAKSYRDEIIELINSIGKSIDENKEESKENRGKSSDLTKSDLTKSDLTKSDLTKSDHNKINIGGFEDKDENKVHPIEETSDKNGFQQEVSSFNIIVFRPNLSNKLDLSEIESMGLDSPNSLRIYEFLGSRPNINSYIVLLIQFLLRKKDLSKVKVLCFNKDNGDWLLPLIFMANYSFVSFVSMPGARLIPFKSLLKKESLIKSDIKIPEIIINPNISENRPTRLYYKIDVSTKDFKKELKHFIKKKLYLYLDHEKLEKILIYSDLQGFSLYYVNFSNISNSSNSNSSNYEDIQYASVSILLRKHLQMDDLYQSKYIVNKSAEGHLIIMNITRLDSGENINILFFFSDEPSKLFINQMKNLIEKLRKSEVLELLKKVILENELGSFINEIKENIDGLLMEVFGREIFY